MLKKKGKFIPGNFDLRVKRSHKGQGLGLVTFDSIKKGECVIEYVGRVITEKEEYTSNSKYLFEINKKKTIDGRPRFNKAGYINHSCQPNCEVEIRKERIYIMAKRNIKEGEELLYDYGEEYFDEHIRKIGCRCVKHRK